MSGSPRKPENGEERLLREAAESVADGHAFDRADMASAESGRVLDNLSRLASLRTVFQGLDEQVGDGAALTAGASDELLHEWGHLRILELLGRGGFGAVYRAFDPLLEREVALKLRREDRAEASATRAYIDEARRLARVRHPNVLAVHGAGIHDGCAGLWSDLIGGESLEQRLSRESLSGDELLVLASQLLEALRAIHRAGLVHGDLKAANVMFDGDHAVLMDFGAAHAVGDRPRQGSVDCMAPELLAGERGDARSDLYSLGALLSRVALVNAPTTNRSTHLRRRLGRRFASLIETLMSTDPEHRPDAKAVAKQLQRIVTAPARRRRRFGFALVIGSLLLGLLASLLALQRVREARARSDSIKDLLVSGIQHSAPTMQSGPASLRTMLDFLAEQAPERLKDFPGALADMRLVIGNGLADLGNSEEGLVLVEQGIEVLRQQPDVTDLHLAGAYSLVANLRGKLSQVAGAKHAAGLAMQHLQRLPADSRSRQIGMIRIRSLLGNLHNDEGDWLAAVAAHQANLVDRTALHGADSPALAVDEFNLGSALSLCGEYAEAIVHLERAAERLRSSGAGDSARMAYVMHALSVARMRDGDLMRASDEAGEAEVLYRRHVGPEHVGLFRLRVLQAEMQRLAGDPQGALLSIRALQDEPGAESRMTTPLRLYALDILVDSGRHAEATQELALIRERLSPLDRPLLPYIDAVERWLGAREQSGGAAVVAAGQIREAVERMRNAGYGQLPQLPRMLEWIRQLESRSAPATGVHSNPSANRS